MKRTPRLCAALVAALSAGAALAGVEDTVWNAQKERAKALKPANAKRLRWAGATGDVAFFAVPAMSDLMRLDDTWPDDGALGGTVRCVVAQDEFESCSFELFAFRDLDGVELSVDLGLPSDLRVVKVWFQNGNGWTSYFNDVGLKLVPELLLHDENLIRVTKEKGGPANHARVRRDGKDTWVWISSPKEMNPKEEPWQYDPGFADADRLLPVTLWKDSFKQFFLTVHPPKDCAPGVYKGSVSVRRKGTELARIPLAVRVLPALVWLIFSLFKKHWSPALYASFLGKLGDARAIDELKPLLNLTDLSYLDYIELRNAVEELGGDPGEDRTFYGDPDYEAMRNM